MRNQSEQAIKPWAQCKDYPEKVAVLRLHCTRLASMNRPNVKQYAATYDLPYQRLLRLYKGGNTRSDRALIVDTRRLSPDQDLALCRYLDSLDAIGYGVHRGLITAQAYQLLLDACSGNDEAPPPIGKQWARRWLKRHPEYQRVKATPMEVLRKLQQQPEGIREWYGKLKAKIDELSIQPGDMWNMDETGCRIGVARNAYIYTKNSRNNVVLLSANNRELCTLVEAVSATGEVIEPMVILKSNTILEHWVEELPDRYAVACSDSGYTNDELALQ